MPSFMTPPGGGGVITALNSATANELVTIGATTTELDAETSMVISGGKLGVGTTTPLTALDVVDGARIKAKATSVLTGSIDPAASTTVTGVGTAFTTELIMGDKILVSGETRTVVAIASDTSLTVDEAFTDQANDTSVDRYPALLSTLNSSGQTQSFQQHDGRMGIRPWNTAGSKVVAPRLDLRIGSETMTGTAYKLSDTWAGESGILVTSHAECRIVFQGGSAAGMTLIDANESNADLQSLTFYNGGAKTYVYVLDTGGDPDRTPIVIDHATGNVDIGRDATDHDTAQLTVISGVIALKETTTPTAVTDYGRIYTKDDNKLYFQDGANTEHEIAYA